MTDGMCTCITNFQISLHTVLRKILREGFVLLFFFFFFFRFYMTKISYLIFLYLSFKIFCPRSRTLTKNESYQLYFFSNSSSCTKVIVYICVFILSVTTKHRNLNLILVRSVLLTESSNFFFLGGGP